MGGEIAHTADAPWAIQLSHTDSPMPNDEYCAATLVKPNKIVTAAHCVAADQAGYTAIQGRDVLSDSGAGQESKIAKIWADPEYGQSPGPQETFQGRRAGVVSWGNGCAEAGYPGVYAQVATYAAALQEQIDS